MKNTGWWRAVAISIVLMCAALCSPLILRAQNIYASLDGVVTDAQNKAVVNATVAILNSATGISRTTVTNGEGLYSFALLQPASYSVSVTAPGFKKAEMAVTLDMDKKGRGDFKLQVGAATERVEVTTEAPLVDTETSAVGDVIDNQNVIDLPLNGRDFDQLALLVPGVTAGIPGNFLGSGLSVAGGRDSTNNYVLDGIDDNEIGETRVSLAPSVEMIAEFKIQENAYNADSGRYGGGQVDITSKSGNNRIHGSAFEFVRNAALDAKNFYDAAAKPPYTRNQYGGSLGGPIIKDRTFYFGSWEGYRINQSLTSLWITPSTAETTGNFSDLLPGTQLVDPRTGIPVSGNVITSPNQIGLSIGKLYPAPCVTTTCPNIPAPYNYEAAQSATTKSDQYNVRVDHRISPKDNVFGRYTAMKQYMADPWEVIWFPFPGYGEYSPSLYQNIMATYTRTIKPNLLNDLRIGFMRYSYLVGQQSGKPDAKALGFTTLDPAAYNSFFDGPPTLTIPPYGNLGAFFVLPQWRHNNTYQLTENVQWIHGAHSVKVGADLIQYQVYQNQNNYVRGWLLYIGESGNGLADAMLDTPGITYRNVFSTPQEATYQYKNSDGFYGQDDWKVNRHLTLNLGLRYEADFPYVWKEGQAAAFNPQTGTIQVPSDVASFLDPTKITLPVTIPVPIQKLNVTSLCDYPGKDWAPRAGFALRSNDTRTVVHGGYGIFYSIGALNQNCGTGSALWAFQETFEPFVAKTNENPFPNTAQVFAPQLNIPSENKTGYIQQYNLSIQRQITNSIVAEVGYLGSKGTHLYIQINQNQGEMSLGFDPATNEYVRPYGSLGFGSSLVQSSYSSTSNYNALVARIEKRATSGLSFMGTYTWAKSLDEWSGGTTALAQNAYNIRGEVGPSGFDERQRATISYVYQLPFGKGRQFGATWKPAVNALLGGWNSTGIFTANDGTPISPVISTSIDYSQTGGFEDRPNVVGNLKGTHCLPGTFFNTCALALPTPGTFGDESRNIIAGPSYVDFDFGFRKEVLLRERYNFDFRAEMFNVLNHPTFLAPNTTMESGPGTPNPEFGTLSSANPAREVQFSIRFSF